MTPGDARRGFTVEAVDYAAALPDLRAIRQAVFIEEQGVPAELELDELDVRCEHVLARDGAGRPIGTGRLTPQRTIGRMAVLREHRGRGVGDAMLATLLERAALRHWRNVSLHAQAAAIPFYLRNGFLPRGPRFVEAGIVHQDMFRSVGVPTPVESFEAARAAVVGIAGQARRMLCFHTRDLDPGILDDADVLAALRRALRDDIEIRVLVHDSRAPREAQSALIALGQRRPSGIAFRVVEEPVDAAFAGAHAFNDQGGWYSRPLGTRPDGETRLDDPARVRQFRAAFQEVWERARPASEFRALGL